MTDTGIFSDIAKSTASRRYYTGDTLYYDVGITLSEAKTGAAIVVSLHQSDGTQVGTDLISTTYNLTTSAILLSTINGSVPSKDTTGMTAGAYYIMVNVTHADIEDETTGKLLGFQLETQVANTTKLEAHAYAAATGDTRKNVVTLGETLYLDGLIRTNVDWSVTGALFNLLRIGTGLVGGTTTYYNNTTAHSTTAGVDYLISTGVGGRYAWTPTAVGEYIVSVSALGGTPTLTSQLAYEYITVVAATPTVAITGTTDKTTYTTAERITLGATTTGTGVVARVIALLGGVWTSLTETTTGTWAATVGAYAIGATTTTPTYYALDDTNEILDKDTSTDITITDSTNWGAIAASIEDKIRDLLRDSTRTYLAAITDAHIYCGANDQRDMKEGLNKIEIVQSLSPDRPDAVASTQTDYTYEITVFTRTFGKRLLEAQRELKLTMGDVIDELQAHRTLDGACDHMTVDPYDPVLMPMGENEALVGVTTRITARKRRLPT